MTQAELDGYRHRLMDLLRRLGRDRSQLKDEALHGTGGEASGSLSDVPLHLGDLGSHEFEEELTLRLIENEEQMIEEINGALERLEQGTFGRCEKCGQPIASDRLQAVPYARHCIDCARQT